MPDILTVNTMRKSYSGAEEFNFSSPLWVMCGWRFGQCNRHVRFGSKADICGARRHVRFAPQSGHSQNVCPLGLHQNQRGEFR